jgi:hypothetical protein
MKNQLPYLTLLAGATLVMAGLPAQAQTPPNATLITNVIAESTVQYVTGTAPTSLTNYVSGYNKVKYSITQPCKSYLKFDFTGQNVNTNYALKFTLPVFNNNAVQHLQIWVLNQGYATFTNLPGFTYANPTLSWSNAQANATGITANDMLTTGSKTATFANDFMDTGGNSGNQGVTLPAPWGQYLANNQLVVVLTATNDAANSANGARFAMNAATVTFQPLTPGTLPPSISGISGMTVRSTTSSGAIAFTVSDPVDAAASLTNFTISLGNTNVTLTSTNIAVVSGGNRTLTFTPLNNLAPGTTASVTVNLIVTDSNGNSATTSFLLTVPPFISLPVVLSGTNVNFIPPTNRIGAGSIIIPFQVVDTNIAASSLVITGSVSAYSTNLGSLSFTSITGIAPNTNNCTVTVNATGSGVGIVNLTIIDPVNSVTNSSVKLAVMVLPDGSYAAYDLMNYQPSPSYSGTHADLLDVSAKLWAARSTSGSVNLITTIGTAPLGMPVGVPLVRGTSSGNQNQLRLIGSPYTAGSHKVVFASAYAQWADTSAYGTTSAYPGTSTGGFVEFAADGSATGVAMAAVCTVSNVANTVNNDGFFYLGLYNGTNAPSVDTSLSQAIPNFNTSGVLPNAPVNVVVSYDVDTGVSTMWLNQSSSAGANVTLQDVAVTNLANVNYVVLRQNANMGDIIVSSLAVKVVTKPVPTITGITKSGNNIVISFTSAPGSGGSASVVGSATVDGTYNTVGSVTINESPASSGNFTASFTDSGSQMFYRIAQTGGTPTVTFPF